MNTNKHLYRSEKNKIISGIMGGIGEYFNVDATLLRLGFLFIVIITGVLPGVVFYIFAMLIVPTAISTAIHDIPVQDQPIK